MTDRQTDLCNCSSNNFVKVRNHLCNCSSNNVCSPCGTCPLLRLYWTMVDGTLKTLFVSYITANHVFKPCSSSIAIPQCKTPLLTFCSSCIHRDYAMDNMNAGYVYPTLTHHMPSYFPSHTRVHKLVYWCYKYAAIGIGLSRVQRKNEFVENSFDVNVEVNVLK